MLPSVVGALLSTVVLVYVLSDAAYTRHKRFIAGARTLRRAIVVVYSVLLVLNLWCATIMPVTLVCDAIAVATLVATGTFGFIIAERRIPATTVVERR
ncbi:hypothetical protein AVL61_13135, partial [Kocuria rosea subsp. polaris]